MKSVVSIFLCLITALTVYGKPETFPFFDGTDKKTESLMLNAERRIEEFRKGDLSVNLVDQDGNTINAPTVVELQTHDFYFGSNLLKLESIPDENPAKQTAIKAIKELFNTVIVCDYWGMNQWNFNGKLNWKLPDYGNRLAEELHKNPRHHALIYGFPYWFHKCTTEEEIWKVIEQRISNIAEHYGDKINQVDVINEFIHYHHWKENEHAKYLSRTHFPDIAKPENGVRVLSLARKHLPQAKLVVLEAGIWSVNNPVFQEILEYHRRLIELGAEYDYIGYQAHYYAKKGVPFQKGTKEYGPRTFMMDDINRGIEEMAKLGKPIVITEFNAPSRNSSNKNPNQPRISDEEVAAWETNFYTLMFSKPYIKGVSRWFTIDNTGGRGLDAGVVTLDGKLKPNYFALKKLIKEKWHTRWNGKPDNGKIQFRGFYGTYEISVEGYSVQTVKIPQDASEPQTVILKE